MCIRRSRKFFAELWPRISSNLLVFFQYYGLQVSIMVLLVMSFYRSNALSVVYLLVVVSLYVLTRRKPLDSLWIPFVILLGVSLIFQYLINMVTITRPRPNRSRPTCTATLHSS